MKTTPRIILFVVFALVAAFACAKIIRPPVSTERSAEQENIKRTNAAAFVKPSDAELRQRLTELQYQVTQHEGTERPFSNEYWDTKAEGIYVDIVSGAPLFSSKDKYKSGTGWPSFSRPLNEEVVEKVDNRLFATRTEIRSKTANSHLGHVFDDGPAPTGKRYCMNSAALRFVAKENLAKLGYAEYLKMFE